MIANIVTSFNYYFFFNDTATTEIYTLSLHDALPIWRELVGGREKEALDPARVAAEADGDLRVLRRLRVRVRSEEHTSELQSRQYLVCRLLLEKKKPDRLPVLAQRYLY